MEVPASLREVTEVAEVDGLALAPLSEWFGELLPHFIGETLRCGGEVALAVQADHPVGLYLFSPGEEIASVFSRSPAVAEMLLRHRPAPSTFAEFALAPGADPYTVFLAEPDRRRPDGTLRHPVRRARPRDGPAIVGLNRVVHGRADERWFAVPRPASEQYFVVELNGELAGAGGSTLIGTTGRLHSLAVHPRFRRLGVGTDLVLARLMFLAAAGARRVYSEIAQRNAPSRAIAERAGMRAVGTLFCHDRPRAPAGSPPRPP